MSLSYTKTRTVKEEKTLRVPTSWGMFSKKGNKRMTAIAQEATDRIEKLVEEVSRKPNRSDLEDELERMFRKYKRLWNTKTYPESGDTAVRNAIRDFGERLAKAAGFSRFDARVIEETAYRNA